MSFVKRLEHLIQTLPSHLERVTEEEAVQRINPESWSRKEILVHLCDSATNNHVRFVKILLASVPVRIETYPQNHWVVLHGYASNSHLGLAD